MFTKFSAENRLNRNLLAWFLISVFCMVGIFLAALNMLQRNRTNEALVKHTYSVIVSLQKLGIHLRDAETGVRGFLLSGETRFLEPYTLAKTNLPLDFKVLDSLVADNPVQMEAAGRLQTLCNSRFLIMNHMIAEGYRGGATGNIKGFMLEGKAVMDSIRVLTAHMGALEQDLLVQRSEKAELITFYVQMLVWAFMLFSVVLGISAFILITRDYALRLKSERQLSSILNSSLSSIMAFKAVRNAEGKITDFEWVLANRKTGDLFGLTPELLEGSRMMQQMPVLGSTGLFDKFVVTTETGLEFITEFERGQLNGKQIWYQVSAARLDDGFAVSFSDISDIKTFERDLRNKVQELERSNSELEQFAFIASHDMQEPLRKIRAFGDRLAEQSAEELGDKGLLYLQKIRSSATRMQVLINDILNYSRIGRLSEPFVSTDLNRVVTDLLQDFDLLIREKEALVTFNNLPIIEADAALIQQLFRNLLSNALKFTKPGTAPVITISCRKLLQTSAGPVLNREASGAFCEIIVTDNGIGFDQKYTDKIFTIFQRLHGRSEFEGTGIGLAICKKIAEYHQGSITALGTPGNGALFVLTLPYKHYYGNAKI